MGSAMAERFKIYGWICRATGVFFIKNLHATDIDELVVAWKSWYTLYSLTCLLIFTSVQIAFVATVVLRLSVSARHFTRSLFFVVPAGVALKVTVNVLSAIFGSWTMMEFFWKSAAYERRAAFLSERYRYRSWISYSLRVLRALAAPLTLSTCHFGTLSPTISNLYLLLGLFTTYVIGTFRALIIAKLLMAAAFTANLAATAQFTMTTGETPYNYYLGLMLKATMASASFLFFFYDMLHSIFLRPCCEVLITYVRHQHDVLKSILPETGSIPMNYVDVPALQRVRLNLQSIGMLRRLLNTTWNYSLMASSAVLLLVGCISVYCVFDKGVPAKQLLLTLSYCFHSTIDLIDMARLSDAMASEVQELKDSLARTPMSQSSPEQLRQVAYVHNSIRPEELSLCGGNFFTLDLPLLVSLAGSIITYSVILVQTSDSVEPLVSSKMSNSDLIEL